MAIISCIFGRKSVTSLGMDIAKHKKFILAVPKGRILKELLPILEACDIVPEADFTNDKSRALRFKTNRDDIDIIRVRAFDVATFVANGAAHIGVVGSDVIEEFDYQELFSPLDLGIGKCRLSVAMRQEDIDKEQDIAPSHIKIASKYPNLTARYYRAQGIQTTCVKLSGAMEIAPQLGLATRIVDLVSTGSTLKANDLIEVETILDVSSRVILNRTTSKTLPDKLNSIMSSFEKVILK